MLDKETYERELIRMWDAHRDEGRRGYKRCHGVKCEECPLYSLNTAFCENSVNAFEIIEEVEKWSNEHPLKPKYKISQLEYDILKYFKYNYIFKDDGLLLSLIEEGYFKGATNDMKVKDYLKDCEIESDDE